MTYRVMIVDDSRLARMSIARLLEALRPEWIRIEAANAEEATALLLQEPADLTLLDFNMPGRDGLTLAGELRTLYPDMPLAIISANMQDEIVARATAVGASFLPKPLTQTALAAFLATIPKAPPAPKAPGG